MSFKPIEISPHARDGQPSSLPQQKGQQRKEEDEVIIAVMGATGAGKSSFINLVTGSDLAVETGLKSCTQGIEVSNTIVLSGRRVTLIDTPGFDDTNLSDTEVLTLIAVFLATTYEKGRLLNGIIFFHRISDPKIGGVSRRNFSMFRKLCGDEPLKNVIIMTNMWGLVDPDVGRARELELANEDMFFKPALEKGAQMMAHNHTLESGRNILSHLINKHPLALLIQRELVDEGKDITETAAGVELSLELAEQARKYKEELENIQEEMREALLEKDAETKKDLEMVHEDVLKNMKKIEDDRDKFSSQYARRKAAIEQELEAARHQLQVEATARAETERSLNAARHSYRRHTGSTGVAASQARLQEERAKIRVRREPPAGAAQPGGRDPRFLAFLAPVILFLCRFI